MKYETKHKIGDLVYIANVYSIDREVIKAIKITGLKEDISYGIENKRTPGVWDLWYRSDAYTWYSSNEIFTSKEDAENLHNSLKAKEEAREAKQLLKKRAKRIARLKREQEALERGEEYEEDEDDDE